MWTPGVRAHYLARVQRAQTYLERTLHTLSHDKEPFTLDILRDLFEAASQLLDTLDMVTGAYKRAVAAAASTATSPAPKGATVPAAKGTSSKPS